MVKLRIAKDILTLQEYLLRHEGQRYCTSCQRHQSIEGGIKKSNRWQCKNCNERRTISMYATKETQKRQEERNAKRDKHDKGKH